MSNLEFKDGQLFENGELFNGGKLKLEKPEHGSGKIGFEHKGPQMKLRVNNEEGELVEASFAPEGVILDNKFEKENGITS
jgi:hypothetical protein